jgi:hypothetical protein
MATYLELVKDVAFDGGTISDPSSIATVQNATGRVLRVARWVTEAWIWVQNQHPHWRFKFGEFDGELILSTRAYDGGALGISSRFDTFVEGPTGRHDLWMSDTTIGQSDEGRLIFMPFSDFREAFMFGNAQINTGRPTHWTVSPDRRLLVNPIPDKEYRVRGVYRKAPQTLSADGDIPDMPEQYHEAIKWRALVLLGTFDEATTQLPIWQQNLFTVVQNMLVTELPKATV